MTPISPTTETVDQARHRLAQKAKEHGVRLRVDQAGHWHASSVSHPGEWHYVTGYSCDCLGFQRVHRCMHHSALLTHFGWLPETEPVDPNPAPSEIAPIHEHHHPKVAHEDLAPALVALVLVDGVPDMLVIGDEDGLSVTWLTNERCSNDPDAGRGDIQVGDCWLAAVLWHFEGHAAPPAAGPVDAFEDAA